MNIDIPTTTSNLPSQQFVDELVYITYKEAASLNKILTIDECFKIAEKIILTNYPKCLVKYLNDEPWSL